MVFSYSIYREETIDNIVGILYVKDLLEQLKTANTAVSIKNFARATYYVPETKSIIEILKRI